MIWIFFRIYHMHCQYLFPDIIFPKCVPFNHLLVLSLIPLSSLCLITYTVKTGRWSLLLLINSLFILLFPMSWVNMLSIKTAQWDVTPMDTQTHLIIIFYFFSMVITLWFRVTFIHTLSSTSVMFFCLYNWIPYPSNPKFLPFSGLIQVSDMAIVWNVCVKGLQYCLMLLKLASRPLQ